MIFVLWPSLKPDPPPMDRGASLSHAQVDPGLSFGQYLDRIEQSRKPYGPADLARRGAYVAEPTSSSTSPCAVTRTSTCRCAGSCSTPGPGSSSTTQATCASRPTSTPTPAAGTCGSRCQGARRMCVQIQLYNDKGRVPIGRIRTPDFSQRRLNYRS
jgi:hypothetical protein